MSNATTKNATKRKPCAHCRTVRDILKTTMDEVKHDSMFCFMSRLALQRIYDNAKKGAE